MLRRFGYELRASGSDGIERHQEYVALVMGTHCMSGAPNQLGTSSCDNAPMRFHDAIGYPSECFSCDSDGIQICYRGWGSLTSERPGVLFVHGFRAHSRWWDFIAPFFVDQYRVFALDFAGMGDSNPRAKYSLEGFSDDIAAVIDAARIAPAILIGHSFGGSRVMRTCKEYPNRVARAIILDSGIYSREDPAPAIKRVLGRPAPYPDKAAILARYRLIPDQPAEAFLRHHVAQHSIRQVEGGWRWKFDANLASLLPENDSMAILSRLKVPIDYVWGELSRIVSPDRAQRIGEALPRGRGPIMLPGAHHHLMLDQPLLLIKTLKYLLAN